MEQRPQNKGKRGTQAILGNTEHRNHDFVFGIKGTRPFFEENKGTGTPTERAS